MKASHACIWLSDQHGLLLLTLVLTCAPRRGIHLRHIGMFLGCRRSAADAIVAVAKLTLPTNQWPDLLPWLLRLTDSQVPAQRQTALRIIGSLAEVLGVCRP